MNWERISDTLKIGSVNGVECRAVSVNIEGQWLALALNKPNVKVISIHSSQEAATRAAEGIVEV